MTDPNVKCDDLILYSDNYPYGLGCSVCNYAPNSLRYLRDHIRSINIGMLVSLNVKLLEEYVSAYFSNY